LTRAKLIQVNLANANLWGAILHGVDLTGANLANANLYQTQFDSDTILPDGENWTPDADLAPFLNGHR
jgi:uncharacterized protein YjbI with pentapeptide repeats